MRRFYWVWLLLTAIAVSLSDSRPAQAQGVLIPRGAVWKYLDNGTDQGTAWKEPGFDDSGWKSGPARLGFGGDGEVTIISFGSNANSKYITTYFRKSFDVPNPTQFATLNLDLLRDDGAVVYLNGTEIRRDNLPAGTITLSTRATTAIGGADEQTFFPSTVAGNLLVQGKNVLAIELHQANGTSSDLSLDAGLRGANVLPTVSILNPSNGASFNAGANITITASASDSDGTVTKVEFFQGSTKLGEAGANPYSIVWNNVIAGQYKLTAVATDSDGATSTSQPVAISVNDSNAPRLLSAVAGGDKLTVTFSKEVTAATALNATHYVIDSGVQVLGASAGSSLNVVVLQISTLATGVTYTLTVSGVQDSIGNSIAANSKITFSLVPFNSADIGGPSIPGSIGLSSGTYSLTASGTDIGGNSDQLFFSYQQLSGDFDMQVRVVGVTASDAWAKAGLMARETLDPASRFAAVLATPSVSGCFFESRSTAASAATTSGNLPVNYPNTWLRLQRTGNQFIGYASFDGQVWNQIGSASIALPSSIFFGMAASSHNSSVVTTAGFGDFENTAAKTLGTATLPWEPLGPSSRKIGIVISEIMYKPAPRTDGKNLEFVELFNSNPFFEDLSGLRLSGDIDFTFPANTILQGGAFLVVAKSPADIRSVYGIANVAGPYGGSLKSSGPLRLRSEIGAILLEIPYSNEPPWPVAADGTGHSLVLSRPSYGEGFAKAWDISDVVGGSPGTVEAYHPSPLRSVVINEFLAHTDPPLLDYIELYNHSNQSVDISGCILSDDAQTNKFLIPKGTILSPRGFAVFDESQLGFALNAGGETIFFKSADQSRVLDAVQFEAQENGVSSGRYPDGADEFYPLASRTPGASNGNIRIRDLVINEIMYAPISGDSSDQYVELFNKGSARLDLSGWKFTAGIKYTFPTNTVMDAGQYLVVAKDAAHLRSNYANLNTGNTVGNFDGKLSGKGERLALAMPDQVISTNKPGTVVTNTIYIVMDEVTFQIGGRWGNWANDGGSSLELRDPRSNHRLASNWADSDETAKAPWTPFEATGVLDNGAGFNGGPIDNLQIVMLGEGECLLDDVEVFRPGNANLISNPNFESGLTGWTPQGNHIRSDVETSGGFNGSQALHIRASARGDTGANRIFTPLTTAPTANQTLTIKAKARWLRGWPEMVLRVHGNWMESFGRLTVPTNLGTPGARNSRAVNNAGPAIFAVSPSPIVPAANESVVISTRVHDSDGVANVSIKYRVDPATSYATVAMRDDGTSGDEVAGDGIYSARIPAQAGGTLVAFYIEASDSGGAATTFPDDAPTRECLVRFGDPTPVTGFGVYRQWFTQQTITTWNNRPTLSNERLDGTFVYGNSRVIYNFSSRYAGSPYHQGFGSPLTDGHYSIQFPFDDLLLGTENFNKVHAPGNGPFDDNTIQREQACFWIARQLGLPWNYRRFVAMYVNGNRRGTLMEDSQVPGTEMVQEYFPDDADGFLYKLQPWFEFDSSNNQRMGFSNNSWCTLNNYATTGGQKKLARYRWNYLVRAANGTANNYTNVFALTDAANLSGNTAQEDGMEAVADMEEWMRIFAARHSVGDWDSFGSQNAQNMYGYKPLAGKWTMFIWDMNIVLGNSGSWQPGQNLFTIAGADGPMQRVFNNPPYRRAYWRALKEIASGPMGNGKIDTVLDAKFAAFRSEGINVTSPSAVKSWIVSARTSLLSQAAAVDAPSLSLNGSSSITTSDNFVLLSGSAPIEVKSITANGIPYPTTWTSITGWNMRVPVSGANTSVLLQGIDVRGNPIANAVATASITYTGGIQRPQDYIVINEIMYSPTVPDASFVEIYNRSPDFTFDLSNDRFHGIDYTFPQGSLLAPQSYLVLAKDATAFNAAYGNGVRVFGQFNGKLDADGETLALVKTGATPADDVTIGKVRFESQSPWPAGATNAGVSLQLIDPAQDNRRVGNWAAATAAPFNTPGGINSIRKDLPPFPTIWINEVLPENLNGLKDSAGEADPWIEIYNNGASSVSLDGLYLSDNFVTPTQWAFPSGIQMKPGEFKVIFADGQTAQSTATEVHTNFRLRPGSGSVALSRAVNGQSQIMDYVNYADVRAGRSFGSLPDGQPFDRQEFYVVTAGVANNGASAPLSVLINEWMASNTQTLADPADGHYDDWFELYNPSANPVDLSGYYLTDTLTNKLNFLIPSGYSIPSHGYLLVWADNEANQNVAGRSDLHVNFKLSKSGQQIGLFAADGTAIDSVSFGPQISDVSEGRSPDGGSAISPMKAPTPGASNISATISGSITVDTTWTAASSPFSISTNLTINTGVTLMIEPGVTVNLGSGVNITVASGGRLMAEGTAAAPIRFTRAPNNADRWGGIVINGRDNSPETRIAFAQIDGNGTTAIHSTGGTLLLDHLSFGSTDHQYVSLDGSSFLISNCHFPSGTTPFELLHGNGGIKPGGRGIVRDSFFGSTLGYNDTMDFTGGSRPGPIIQFLNNVFTGSSDDILDLDGTDAWVEGNIFLHAHKNGAPDTSSAISGGNSGGDTSEVTIIGNLFFDCDQACTAKQGNFFTLFNNTIVHMTKTGGQDTASGVVCVRDLDPSPTTFGAGYYLEGNIVVDADQLVRNYIAGQTTVTFNNNILPAVWDGPGSGNAIVDPKLKHIPQVSETQFTNWNDAQIVRDWFSLLPGSPAIGTGPNGRDKGGVIPLGVSISGEPGATTDQSNATLVVGLNRSGSGIPAAGWPGGSGFTHYKWRLDSGQWSAETLISSPIPLAGLALGQHFVEVVGKGDSGWYQDDPAFGPDATVFRSRTWTVQAAGPLSIASTFRAGTEVTLRFSAAAGQTYTVQYKDSIDAPSWLKLSDVSAQPSTSDMVIKDTGATGPSRFYRIVTPAQ